jgi:hypothetical protein
MRLLELLSFLPPDLVGSAVLSKLSLLDIVQLDSACVEKKYRSELFLIYQSTSLRDLQSLLPSDVNEEILRWLFQRKALLGNVVIHGAELATSQLLADNAECIRGELTLSIDTPPATLAQLDLSISLEQKFRELKVGQDSFCIPQSLETTTMRLPFRNLRSIAWSEDFLSDACLVPLIADNRMLDSVDIACFIPLPASIPAALCVRGDTLRTLKLSCADITNEHLHGIAHSCRLLTDFQLKALDNKQITEAGISAVILGCGSSLERIKVELFNLRAPASSLLVTAFINGIYLSRIHLAEFFLNDDALLQLPHIRAPLRELSCCWGVTSVSAVTSCGSTLSALYELNIGDVGDASSASLCVALERMPQLRSLTLRNLSLQRDNEAALLDAIAVSCVRLTKLWLWGRVSSSIESLAWAVSIVTLVEVEVMDREGVNDAVVLALASHCPQLTKLRIKGKKVTDIAVVALARGCRKLNHVDMHYSVQLTDESVLALAEHCTDLTTFALDGMRHVTDTSVTVLARNCRKLQYVHLAASPHLTDASVLALAENSCDLRSLDVCRSHQIREPALVHLIHSCRKLKFLTVTGHSVSIFTVEQMFAQRPSLNVWRW